jgi:hypothetical protein
MAHDAPDEIARLRMELLDFVLAELAASDASGLRADLAASVTAEVERKLETILPQWTQPFAGDQEALVSQICARVLAGLPHASDLSEPSYSGADGAIKTSQIRRRQYVAQTSENGAAKSLFRWRIGALMMAALAAAAATFAYLAHRDARASEALAASQATKVQAQCDAGQSLRQGLDKLEQPKKGLAQCDPKLRETKPSAACATAMAIEDGLSRLDRVCASAGPAK